MNDEIQTNMKRARENREEAMHYLKQISDITNAILQTGSDYRIRVMRDEIISFYCRLETIQQSSLYMDKS